MSIDKLQSQGQEFLRNRLNAREEQGRFTYAKTIAPRFDIMTNYDSPLDEIIIEKELSRDISLSKDNYELLLLILGHYSNQSTIDMAREMLMDNMQEKKLRDSNHALKAAYEKYQTLLKLVDSESSR